MKIDSNNIQQIPMTSVSVEEAHELILRKEAPAGMVVDGHLNFAGNQQLTALPAHLSVRRLTVDRCPMLCELPSGLCCYELSAQSVPLTTLPPDLQVQYRLDLSDCQQLRSLPAYMRVGSLVLRNCTVLEALSTELDVCFLDIEGCTRLAHLSDRGPAILGLLNVRGCANLRSLPSWLQRVAQLDISGCVALTEIPAGVQISSWLDIANSGLQGLPISLQGVRLRWRDVLIDEQIAFHPEALTVSEITQEANAERRRVMLERFGYDQFIEQADAEVLHQDRDPGGERRLLRVQLADDEPLVGLAVQCPSTDRRYFIRVPPTMQSCHQAAAWIAGFDNPDDYQPLAET